MLKLMGALAVIGACLALGSYRAAELRARARLLSALCSALELLSSEITCRLTDLPDAAERLSLGGPAASRDFFAMLAQRMERIGERGFSEIWDECVAELPSLAEAERSALCELGLALGRYGAQEQAQAIALCRDTLGAAAERESGEAARGGKLATSLGLTVGLLLAVLLI